MRSARRLLWPVLAAVGVGAEMVGFGFDDPGSWVPDLLTGWVIGGQGSVILLLAGFLLSKVL